MVSTTVLLSVGGQSNSLAQYDIIVGMDWLSCFSPMQVDWKHKWLKIPYANSFRVLQGDLQELPPGTLIQVSHITTEGSVPQADSLPSEISQLLEEFHSVFEPPQRLSSTARL